jgi:SAM-dependent MidA family methyltransferase
MTFASDLINDIKAKGFMPLEEYMARCNAEYYNAQRPFGTEGDFITAPEISQMFGEIIAAWSVDSMAQHGSVNQFSLLECGPGRGILLNDILRLYNHHNILSSIKDILLLENSESLKKVQKEKNVGHQLQWIDNIHSLQTSELSTPLFVYANEFLDALPIEQYVFKSGDWYKRGVSVDKSGALVWNEQKSDIPSDIPATPKEGGIFEQSPAIKAFIKDLIAILKKQGVAVFIDYGYKKTAFGDSFQAVKSHKFVDPLDNPGQVDLTAHVNFEAIRNICKDEGMHVYGPVTQKTFLQSCGIQERARALASNANERQQKDIASALHRLISSGEMGDLFKVIAISDKLIEPIGMA